MKVTMRITNPRGPQEHAFYLMNATLASEDYSDNPDNIYHKFYQIKWNRILGTVIFTLVLCLLFGSTQNKVSMFISILSLTVIFVLFAPAWHFLVGISVMIKDEVEDWFSGY